MLLYKYVSVFYRKGFILRLLLNPAWIVTLILFCCCMFTGSKSLVLKKVSILLNCKLYNESSCFFQTHAIIRKVVTYIYRLI